MKEFETDITAFFDKGLRADFRNKRNSPGLLGCNNLKPTAWGISPFEPVSIPISVAELASWNALLNWPYPRLHKGMKNTFMTMPQQLFYVLEDWSLQGIDIYSYATPTDLVTPVLGSLWQLIDFYDTWIFTNGRGCAFKFNVRNALGQTTPEKVFYSSALRATAGADFKGRAVLAGFDPDRTWNSKLSSIFALGDKSAQSGISFANTFKGFQNNFVMWSTIGGGDLLFWFDENASFNFNEVGLLQNGLSGYGASKPFVLDQMRKNQLGWMPLQWPGMIKALKPLGDSLIAYGDGGVSELFSAAEPVATLGQRKLGLVGVISEGAVGGDEAEHVYMDKSGTLWSLAAGKLPERLGYKEWFQDFIQSDPVISFNPDQREWYISNGWKSFVLTKQGLGRHSQILTSTIYHDGQVLGLGTSEFDMDRQASLVTEIFDFGNSLIKTITSVEFSFTTNYQSVSVAVDYRYKRNGDFVRTAFKSLPDFAQRGFVRFPVAGVEFRLVLRWNDFQQAEPPDQVVVKWQQTDKSNLRTRANVSATAQ